MRITAEKEKKGQICKETWPKDHLDFKMYVNVTPTIKKGNVIYFDYLIGKENECDSSRFKKVIVDISAVFCS